MGIQGHYGQCHQPNCLYHAWCVLDSQAEGGGIIPSDQLRYNPRINVEITRLD